MDLISQTIEQSKHNNMTKIDGKYVFTRKFAPHITLRWSRREILEDRLKRS